MIDSLGPEREKLAFLFRTLPDGGIVMTFGSDILGNAGAIFFTHLKYVLNSAVNRSNSESQPEGGWVMMAIVDGRIGFKRN
jgi:hypothetical protein